MKVAVITRHAITNYGSLLQSIATEKMIKKCGHSCRIIDYIRDDETPENWDNTILSTKSSWSSSAVKKAAYLAIRKPDTLNSGKYFEKMRKRYLTLTERCSNEEELLKVIEDSDIVMTGSDQVWGPVADGSYDPAYFLSFVPNGKKKVAYAASMGKMQINDSTVELFKKHLSSYDSIAVREQAASDFLSENGISSKVVLDPTLMLSGEVWGRSACENKRGRYVLVYQLHNDERVGDYAKIISERLGVKVIRVSPDLHQCIRGGRFVYLPNVHEFLSLIKNAEFMVTDSFHGTAFAINFNTPFAEVLPQNGTNSRNVGILNMTGLSDRIATSEEEIKKIPVTVDFTNANEVLKEKRMGSFKILKEMLG